MLNSASRLAHGDGTMVVVEPIDVTFFTTCPGYTGPIFSPPPTLPHTVMDTPMPSEDNELTTTPTVPATTRKAAPKTTTLPALTPVPTVLGTLAPTTVVPSKGTGFGFSFTITIQVSLSITVDNFVTQTNLFVQVVANVLLCKQPDIKIVSLTTGSAIVVFEVGTDFEGHSLKALLVQEASSSDSDLSRIFGLQTVEILNDPQQQQQQPSTKAASTGTRTKPKSTPVVAIGVGIAIGVLFFVALIVLLSKWQSIRRRMGHTSAEAELRRLTKAIRNCTDLPQLEQLGREAEAIFRSECSCMSTGVCGVCKEYKIFLQQCSECRTEFVVSELTAIIGRARGPDIMDVQADLENAVDALGAQCGCNFGRAWSEPAAEMCPHEALVTEFCEIVRVQNIQHLSNPPPKKTDELPNYENLPF